MPLAVFAVIGTIFGAVGGVMAFLITYNEYQRHGLGARRTWRESLSSAAVAFTFFFLASLLIGFVLSHR